MSSESDVARRHRSSRTRTTAWLLALLVGAALVVGARCNKAPRLVITSPANGIFTTAGSIVVTGEVRNVGAALVDLTVNGVSGLPLGPDGSFSVSVPLDPAKVFNPLVAEATRSNGPPLRARVTAVAGDSIADGGFSPMGVALRLNDSGLDQAEPLITSLVNLDPATLLAPGTQVIDNFCIGTVFGLCTGRVDVYITNPPASLSGFGIQVDALANDSVDADIDISSLEVNLFVDGVSGIAPDCDLTVTASNAAIAGDYGLQPEALDPSLVDVFQNGLVNVDLTGFSQEFTSGLCDFPLIGDLIQLIIGDLEGTVEGGFENFLNAVDPAGNTPVAGAIEVALADIEISGPIGEAIGVNLETPLFDVFEDADGITLDSDARITASLPVPQAPDLLASYHVDEAFPPFGPTTPVSALPYDLAICISTSAFNQLLKAEIESGLLIGSLTEFDLGGTIFPLTAEFLSAFVPEFAGIDPQTPLRIDLAPKLAPVLTGNPGPAGELNEMRIGHLDVKVVVDGPSGQLLLHFAVDVKVGLNVDFVAGELSFGLGNINPANIDVTILQNTLSSSEPGLETLVQQLGAIAFPDLASSLETFPLPDFLGLSLSAVEVSKNGEFTSLFFDLQ